MQKKLIVANWKMNPVSIGEAIGIARLVDRRSAVLCPPFGFLRDVGKILKDAELGAQDVFWERSGPYTGEMSPAMLKNLGVRYVIVGHSERRKWLGETDGMINKKVLSAIAAGLKVILCVGEPWPVRRKGLAAAKKFVASQLRKDLRGAHGLKIIVAYEPIWAIGSGRADRPSDTAEMAEFIKSSVAGRQSSSVAVLYGGSVNGKNAKSFLQYKEIDGALVGGASLKAGEFKKIVKTASNM